MVMDSFIQSTSTRHAPTGCQPYTGRYRKGLRARPCLLGALQSGGGDRCAHRTVLREHRGVRTGSQSRDRESGKGVGAEHSEGKARAEKEVDRGESVPGT